MYSFDSPLDSIKGIGPKLFEKFQEKHILTFKDLLLFLPLRYSDRSNIVQIQDLKPDVLVSFPATVTNMRGFYKNRRRIDSAVAQDATGKVKLMWFNNKFIAQTVKNGATYMISGKLNNRGTIVQPTLEKISDTELNQLQDQEIEQTDTIHTGRLVPIYSSTLDVQQGKLRRILKQALTQYSFSQRDIQREIPDSNLTLKEALTQLHFPDSEDQITVARERLALEELLALIKTSEKIKKHWKELNSAQEIQVTEPKIPNTIPFELTDAQKRCVSEILDDLQSNTPMNRMLIGDVGSGKTVVAGIGAYHTLLSGKSVALIAPTKILAEQHYQTIQTIFPEMNVQLITGGKKTGPSKLSQNTDPVFFIGTHAVITQLATIKPTLVIYDEQHRFGVAQRSQAAKLAETAHTLTMSATPIPRSLMLTIFSHLQVSTIDELPKGRKPTKTWVVPETKRTASYEWIAKQLSSKTESDTNAAADSKLALVICPFIDPSSHEAFENVASAKETFESISAELKKIPNGKKLVVGLLHGRMKKPEQEKIISQLYENKIDVLVTTPIVEVGVDLPTAEIIVIEAAERFGMASLHQLRGRVGRAGQQGYCLLFSEAKSPQAKQRLETFSQETNGLKLAELDLKNRGSGDIFGVHQSGFSNLQFASWTNLDLIAKAQTIYKKLPRDWEPILSIQTETQPDQVKPLAN